MLVHHKSLPRSNNFTMGDKKGHYTGVLWRKNKTNKLLGFVCFSESIFLQINVLQIHVLQI